MTNKQFQNKYVLVTGASTGIGQQIAKDFLLEGAHVAAHYCNNKKEAEKLLEFSKNCTLIQADFSQSDDVMKLWDEFIAWSKGKIDVLVNNAGAIYDPAPFSELSMESWERTQQVNLKAPFLLSRAALAVMAKRKEGRIINISSGGWLHGGGEETMHYSASKAGLEAITKAFAKVGARNNVLVNAVRAGATDTPFHKKMGRTNIAARVDYIPLKRLAKTTEISNAVLFLASDNSSYTTNTIISVTGGE
ncbi:MAG: SDR family NAD(P)-dependent oxidoreductase [Nanoarchaeota archaeon]|nr:SDR family NAD(P)-dependent oxidoreductase [Nanoarchaeota archaeon]